jgi:hypothetical protein
MVLVLKAVGLLRLVFHITQNANQVLQLLIQYGRLSVLAISN